MYRTLIAAAALLTVGAAGAQTAQTSSNPAVKDSAPVSVSNPAEGRNSFTEDQARTRLAKKGYTVASLTKNDDGVWTGSATKRGKTVTVGLDYKGNVTTR